MGKNRVQVEGELYKDVNVTEKDGKKRVNLFLKVQDGNITTYIAVKAFGKLAQLLYEQGVESLQTGTIVKAEGKLVSEKRGDGWQMVIWADDILFTSPLPDEQMVVETQKIFGGVVTEYDRTEAVEDDVAPF